MSTRRSSSRSMMRSFTPCRPSSLLRGSATSSQLRNAARWSSPQNFERAFSAAQSASVSVTPSAAQSAVRRMRYCEMWNRKVGASSCCWMVAMSSRAGGGTRPSAMATR